MVVCAPSGAGKTSICKKLVSECADVVFSISATTRSPRGVEKHGQEYFFMSKEEFSRASSAGEFLEQSFVFGNFYGTPKASVERYIECGMDVVLDVDCDGARQISSAYPSDSVTIYIFPPSIEELANRLVSRNENSADEIERRLKDAELCVANLSLFDYIVVNDNLQKAYEDVKSIIRAEKLKTSRRELSSY